MEGVGGYRGQNKRQRGGVVQKLRVGWRWMAIFPPFLLFLTLSSGSSLQ